MATEKRLIDANALKELISRRSGNMQNDWSSPAVLLAVECQPTVDAVEVVRCKDCKHFEYGCQCYHPLGATLGNHGYLLVDGEDDFCSNGERRTDV